ncbi:MAG: tetratricopeptide repeat-containing sulfotransferase family protein [Wenzhouxiangellaceae bacterium]
MVAFILIMPHVMQSTPQQDQTPDKAAGLIQQARQQLQNKQFNAALALADSALEIQAQNSEALYLRAVCQRYLSQHEQALETLSSLQQTAPEYARCYQEAGHCYRQMNDANAAIRAYQQAVSLNPALPASWQALSALYQQQGDDHARQHAQAHSDRLRGLPRELVSVASMIHEGRLYRAERLCRHFLQQQPQHTEAMRLLAQIGSRLYVLDDAEFLLESALEFEPDNLLVRFDYVNVLHQRQKFAQALEQASQLRQSQPGNPSFETSYANELMAVGDFDQALAIYDQILQRLPDNPQIHLSRGHALKTVGQQDDAIQAYRAAYQAKTDFGDAYWSLANLKTYRFDDGELRTMREQEANPLTTMVDRYHLCFALGKAYEDRQEYAASFDYYERGNALKKAELRYSAERMDADLERQKKECTRELFEHHQGHGHSASDPIFIVGLPRAGSTLIEQILASHSQVEGTLELPNILALVHRLNGRRQLEDEPRYPALLGQLEADKLAAFGRDYIEQTRIHRSGAPLFIDKMPNNFRHVGLIHLILPNARIIDARRHPMACCFSGFKQLFGEGQEFTYGLEQIGRYYRGYEQLMSHWDQALPGKVLRVQYENVIADLESQVKRLLDFLDLPFEDACVEFHKTRRSVRTASSEQVRQPIYQSSVEQWRHYEPWLEPLKTALGESYHE